MKCQCSLSSFSIVQFDVLTTAVSHDGILIKQNYDVTLCHSMLPVSQRLLYPTKDIQSLPGKSIGIPG